MRVTFIAHAGVAIKEAGTEILIDPWFSDSTVKHPILEPVAGYPTIDFQIPKSLDRPERHAPDAILVSHFHSHHAPYDDIMTLVAQTAGKKDTSFLYPDLGERGKQVDATFTAFEHVHARPMCHSKEERVGPLSVTALEHTVREHVAWLVRGTTGTVLHIADPTFNTRNAVRELDDAWRAFAELRPSLLFINAGGNSVRREKDGVRTVVESGAVSPVEAAKIVALIKPAAVSLIGCYNHSVWKNREEYIPPAGQIEEEFYWALSWLAPDVQFVAAKPGYVYGIGGDAAEALIRVKA